MRWLAAIITLASVTMLFAVNPDEILDDPVLEARARTISSEIRCVVCQSENIDFSDAQVAKDLRILLREKLTEGMTDSEVKDYLTDRYGDFVLLKPRFSGSGVVLWLVGPILFLLGLFTAIIFIRKSGKIDEEDFDDETN